jgi:hypothetical protein
MFHLRRVFAVALVLVLAGCATERGFQQLYVPLGTGSGFGYTDQPSGERRFVVTYDAPISTAFSYDGGAGRRAADGEVARAYDFALLRAAEVALSQGMAGFRVVDRTNDVDVRNRPTYRGSFWYPYWGRPYGYPYGPFGWPYAYGPYDDGYATLSARVTLNIELLPNIEPGVFDAQNVLATIRARYTIPEA